MVCWEGLEMALRNRFKKIQFKWIAKSTLNLVYSTLFIFTCACSISVSDKTFNQSNHLQTLIASDTLVFERDSTSHGFYVFQHLPDDFEERYLLGNREGHSLIFYNEHGKIVRKHKIDFEGPYGFSRILGIYAHSKDTIAVFSDSQLFLSNHLGEFYKKYLALDINQKALNMISISTPARILGDHIYFNTLSLSGYHNLGLSFRLNLQNEQLALTQYYPDDLQDGFWVGAPFINSYSTFNPKQQSIYYGLAFDPFIREVDYKGSEKKFRVVPSDYIDFEPLFRNAEDYKSKNAETRKKMMFSRVLFGPIAFDTNRNLIYRICFLPTNASKALEIDSDRFPESLYFKIIVYDLEQEKLIAESEPFAGAEFETHVFLVNKNGFYIKLKDTSEDEASFLGFTINPIAE
jgi:hypothetical protein